MDRGDEDSLPAVIADDETGGSGAGSNGGDSRELETNIRESGENAGGDICAAAIEEVPCEPCTSNTVDTHVQQEGEDPDVISPTPSDMEIHDPEANLDDNDHRYVGLVNQAMTCYLNSLIQTLYMTPEFRNAIYRWRFTGSETEAMTCIPGQLQKLFLLLQTSEQESLETVDLTASFGWDGADG
ncbi:unnamed protein product [Gongylonema pulchrum]|uniref:USP domain-containing protein n=1 Tax=Gongylonema pulchrum TaxID=637853 RepID=A0A183E943_9BILA|nr:unnamed protein product [Gongylonema pulchrum]